MAAGYRLHGARGAGSVAIEAAMTLLDLAYEIEDVKGPPSDWTALAKINPMRQVPTLVLPGGEIMTESAAILIWLADSHPSGGLAPTLDSPLRPTFLRWMAFVAASIYGLYWIYDEPSRLTDDLEEQAVIKARLEQRISQCWATMESQLGRDAFLLGDEIGVLDLYVTVISRWEPGRARLRATAPRIAEVVGRVDAEPRLADLWARRFPLPPASEG